MAPDDTLIGSEEELLAALRRRREELGLTYEQIDARINWASGYCGKVLPQSDRVKRLSTRTLCELLQALCLKIQFVSDETARARIRDRRRRAPRSLAIDSPVVITHSRRKLREYGRRGGLEAARRRRERRAITLPNTGPRVA